MKSFLSKSIYLLLITGGMALNAEAQTSEEGVAVTKKEKKAGRLSLGGYGEAVMSRFFYSDNYKRYSKAEDYKSVPSRGQFDLPHVVLFLSYDFGKGWKMSSEIEFEHGGTESAVEIEAEENGEYEKEIERGGEVALEQFWIEKTFSNALNLRLGHMIVPVGYTNGNHLPVQFFGVYRPEGESSIMPCTWHETGISIWGRAGAWRYEAMLLPGLDADRFNNQNWIQGGAGSPYEFKIANAYAGAVRIDNYSVKGLRIGLSGYIGNSASNSMKAHLYEDIKGTVGIGAIDFDYEGCNWIARGNFDYGHLTNSAEIYERNKSMSGSGISPRTTIGSDAIAVGVEAGYNLFSQIAATRQRDQKLYLFGRYDYYDSMFKTASGISDSEWCGRHNITVGLNYYPIKEIVIKAQYANRLLKSKYNDEQSISLGVAYAGFFTK